MLLNSAETSIAMYIQSCLGPIGYCRNAQHAFKAIQYLLAKTDLFMPIFLVI